MATLKSDSLCKVRDVVCIADGAVVNFKVSISTALLLMLFLQFLCYLQWVLSNRGSLLDSCLTNKCVFSVRLLFFRIVMHISDIIANVADLHLFLDLLRVECYPFILSGQKADERVSQLAYWTICIFLSLSYVVISCFEAFKFRRQQRVCRHAWDESKCLH